MNKPIVTGTVSALDYLKWGIDYWDKAFKMLPERVGQDVIDNAKTSYEDLAKLIVDSMEQMAKFEKHINEKRTTIYNELDNTWKGFYDRYQSIDEKIKKLDKIFYKIDCYQAEKVLDVLSRLDSIPAETWKRYELLARNLK